ncbi:putative TRAP dicarboxylate transporter, DctQ subunit [Candidatus Vecturithrix granuli]|uniref:Putative TRAP dicarboxylate transporter, DctQ subunit n=1 Tax=Vecturithrix granuli TaxID=1499967 RepID=A0A081BU96_VECG1|nr:putative TRAP dicarboxylate transporter, DctQ subunit [Candidatus Vecturithrix granuli]
MKRNILHFFDHFEEYALLLLFPLMVVVVFVATLARYFNLFPMFWGEEVARYIMVYMAYIGAGLAMKNGAHVGVSFLVESIKNPTIRRIFDGLRLGIILFFCGIIIYYIFQIITSPIFKIQTTPALFMPMWVPYTAVPLGMILISIRAIQAFWRASLSTGTPEKTVEPGK